MTGKTRRMGRLFVGPERRCLLVPLDHGPWMGPAKGIDRPLDIAEKSVAGGANALLVSPGFARAVEGVMGPHTGLVLRVSIPAGLAPEATQETPVATVETALRLDADAVAVSIFFGRGGEVAVLRYLGQLTEEANRYGMPVLAEMMPPGDKSFDASAIAHAVRIGFELGADIVKTNYCGEPATFADVVAGTPVPIIVAGGPSKAGGEGEAGVLQLVKDVLSSGAAGVAIGRRVWQSPDPAGLVRKMRAVMFAGA